MPDSIAARSYLEKFLSQNGLEMKTASTAVGMNHAYLQQYIRNGKPRWLPEPVREGLVKLYGVDGDRLRPPPAPLHQVSDADSVGDQGGNQPEVHAPKEDQFSDESGLLELIDLWRTIPRDRRRLALNILRNLADRSASSVA